MASHSVGAVALAVGLTVLGASCRRPYISELECWPPDAGCVGDEDTGKDAEDIARSFKYCLFREPRPLHIETPSGRSRFEISPTSRPAPWWRITGEPGLYFVRLTSEPRSFLVSFPAIDKGVALEGSGFEACFTVCFGPGCAPVVAMNLRGATYTASDELDLHVRPQEEGVRYVDLSWEPAPAGAPLVSGATHCPAPWRAVLHP